MSGQVFFFDGNNCVGNNSVGTAGQVLTSNGGGAPTFQDPPLGIYFAAYYSGSATITHFDPAIYDTIITNVGGGYDNTTGIFTAPQAGFYYFNASFNLTNLNAASPQDLNFLIYSASPYYQIGLMFLNPTVVADVPEGYDLALNVAGMANLVMGQTVQVRINVDTSAQLNGNTNFQFSGFRIGA